MTTKYDGPTSRALSLIARKGSDVLFPALATVPVFDESANEWTPASPGVPIVGKAVQTANNADLLTTLGLLGHRVITLLIAAKNLAIVPVANAVLSWAGVSYTIRNVDTLAPDGEAIIYTVVAAA